MIRTTGFRCAFLMRQRRGLSPYSQGNSFPGSFTSHGWHRSTRPSLYPYLITSHHVFVNRIFDNMIPSQPRYNVKPENFKRLFLLPWKNK